VLAGSEAVVSRARLMLARLGGATIHKAGIAAAAGLVAIETTIHRIADDHRRARDLAVRLAAIPGLRLDPSSVETNIVLVDITGTGLEPEKLAAHLADAGVRALPRETTLLRFVLHREIDDDDVVDAARVVHDVVERHTLPPFVLPEVEGFDEAAFEAERD